MRQLWNRQCKQDNRWLRAKVERNHRSGITIDVERELIGLFRAPSKREQEKLKLRPDLQLSIDAKRLWEDLRAERRTAMAAQGQKFEAEDWWLEGEAGEEGKTTSARERMEELTAMMGILGVRGQEFVAENEDGEFVFLSPEGSVVGEGEEDEDEDEDDGGVEVA